MMSVEKNVAKDAMPKSALNASIDMHPVRNENRPQKSEMPFELPQKDHSTNKWFFLLKITGFATE